MTQRKRRVSPEQVFKQYKRLQKAKSNVIAAQHILEELAALAGPVNDIVFDDGNVYRLHTCSRGTYGQEVEVNFLASAEEFNSVFQGDNG